MRRKFILFGLLFISTLTCISQTVTLEEMLNRLSCESFECFNDFAVAKNFKYTDNSGTTEDTEAYSFESAKEFTASSNKAVVMNNLFQCTLNQTTKVRSVCFYTFVEGQYLELLRQMKELEFVSDGKKEVANNISEICLSREAETYISQKYPGRTLNVFIFHYQDAAGKYEAYSVALFNGVKK